MTNPTPADWRALCAELVDCLEKANWPLRHKAVFEICLADARAALAQPDPISELVSQCHPLEPEMGEYLTPQARWRLYGDEAQPEPVALTDAEIQQWADAAKEVPLEEMDPEVHGWRRCFTAKEFSETIRAALAHWGTPAIAAKLKQDQQQTLPTSQ